MKARLLAALFITALSTALASLQWSAPYLQAQAASHTLHVTAHNKEQSRLSAMTWGRVTSSPAGIDCGMGKTKCDASFAAGTNIVLTGTPMDGDISFEWGSRGSSRYAAPKLCSELDPNTANTILLGKKCSFTMPNEETWAPATAAYEKVRYTVNKAGSGKGTVVSEPAGLNCGPSCVGAYPTAHMDNFQTSITIKLTAKPDPGSVFVRWDNPKKAPNIKCATIKGPVCTDIIAGSQSAVIAVFDKVGGTPAATPAAPVTYDGPTSTEDDGTTANGPSISTAQTTSEPRGSKLLPWPVLTLLLALGLVYLYLYKFRRDILPLALGGKAVKARANKPGKAAPKRPSKASKK